MTCVSWAHCNMTLFLRHVAVQTRDRQKGAVCYGPGSAAHHERARRRAQTAHAALRPGHTTDSLILGQALSTRIRGQMRMSALILRGLGLFCVSRNLTALPNSCSILIRRGPQ